MGALPRPELPPGAHRELVQALHDLHHRAGWPSLRTLARCAGVSHTTVSTVFSSPKVPSWGTLELVVEAMDGPATEFHRLWLEASGPTDGAFLASAMAGRKQEQIRVRHHFDAGQGLLLVTGEAGIGKTTVVTTSAAGADAFVAVGACRPLSSSVPLLPIADLLRHVLRENPAWVTDALAVRPAYVGESLNQLLPELGTAGTRRLSDEWARPQLFTAIAELLAALREHRSIGVFIEDGHWADPTTLDVLELLGSKTVPLVITWRTDDPDASRLHADWLSRARRLPGATTLALGPLTPDETACQLALLTGREPTPPEVERIHARSLGQPLFTEQLALHPDDQPLPELLADLLLRRLRGIGDDAWAVARTLGVADRPLDTHQLAEITGDDPVNGLRALQAQRLLAPADGGPQICLRHPLVADAIRSRLVPGEAPEVHRRIATALTSEPDPPAAEIAQHWAEAGDAEQELLWRISAAQAASARFASQAEADQWQRVIDLWPDELDQAGEPPLSRADMLRDALLAIRRVDLSAALPHLDLAVAVAEKAPAPQAAGLLISVANIHLWNHEPTTARELNLRAVSLLEGLPPSVDYVNALSGLEACLEHTGRYQQAREIGDRAVAAARDVGDPCLLKLQLADRFWHESLMGNPAAQVLMEELSGIVVDPPDPYCELRVAASVTDVLLFSGAPAADVAEAARPALAAAGAWGAHPWTDAIVRANVAEAQIAQGKPAAAWDLVAPYTDGDHHQERWPLHNQRALLELLAGRTNEARRRLVALESGPRGVFAYRLIIATTGATVDLWTGRPKQALDRALAVLEDGTDNEEPAWLAALLCLAARAAADLDDPGRVTPLLELRTNLSGDPFQPHPLIAGTPAHGATWVAELARLQGNQTVEGWLAAAATWDRLSRPYDAGYARWRAAQIALRTGQGTTADTLLKRAAHQANGHVPLKEAIRRTASGPKS